MWQKNVGNQRALCCAPYCLCLSVFANAQVRPWSCKIRWPSQKPRWNAHSTWSRSCVCSLSASGWGRHGKSFFGIIPSVLLSVSWFHSLPIPLGGKDCFGVYKLPSSSFLSCFIFPLCSSGASPNCWRWAHPGRSQDTVQVCRAFPSTCTIQILFWLPVDEIMACHLSMFEVTFCFYRTVKYRGESFSVGSGAYFPPTAFKFE